MPSPEKYEKYVYIPPRQAHTDVTYWGRVTHTFLLYIYENERGEPWPEQSVPLVMHVRTYVCMYISAYVCAFNRKQFTFTT